MNRIVQYLLITALSLCGAYCAATAIAQSISDSLNASADIIAKAGAR